MSPLCFDRVDNDVMRIPLAVLLTKHCVYVGPYVWDPTHVDGFSAEPMLTRRHRPLHQYSQPSESQRRVAIQPMAHRVVVAWLDLRSTHSPMPCLHRPNLALRLVALRSHLVLTVLRGLAVVFSWKCTGFQDELLASSYTCDGFPQRCVTAFSTCKRLSRHSPFAYPWTAFTTPVPYRHFVHLPIFPSTAELSSVRLQPSFNFPQIGRCYDGMCDSQCGTRYASPCSKSIGIVVEISTGQDKALT